MFHTYDAFRVGREPGGAERGAQGGRSKLRMNSDDGEHLLPVAGGVVLRGGKERAEGILRTAAAEDHGGGGRLEWRRATDNGDGEGEGGHGEEEAHDGEEEEEAVSRSGGGRRGGEAGGGVGAARLGLVVGAVVG